jgi:hypothetical protein
MVEMVSSLGDERLVLPNEDLSEVMVVVEATLLSSQIQISIPSLTFVT